MKAEDRMGVLPSERHQKGSPDCETHGSGHSLSEELKRGEGAGMFLL